MSSELSLMYACNDILSECRRKFVYDDCHFLIEGVLFHKQINLCPFLD